jgi:hypothetical protein
MLPRAGLISRGRDAQRRPCRLEAAPLREVTWMADYRRFRDQRFDYLKNAQAEGRSHGRKRK